MVRNERMSAVLIRNIRWMRRWDAALFGGIRWFPACIRCCDRCFESLVCVSCTRLNLSQLITFHVPTVTPIHTVRHQCVGVAVLNRAVTNPSRLLIHHSCPADSWKQRATLLSLPMLPRHPAASTTLSLIASAASPIQLPSLSLSQRRRRLPLSASSSATSAKASGSHILVSSLSASSNKSWVYSCQDGDLGCHLLVFQSPLRQS